MRIDVHAERIAAVKEAGRRAGVDIVVNARTDAFALPGRDDAVDVSIERGRAYLAAGADCCYPIAAGDEDDIRALVSGIGGPVNVLLRKGVPGPDVLRSIGVARVSLGSGLHRIALRAASAERRQPRLRAGDLSFLLASSAVSLGRCVPRRRCRRRSGRRGRR